MPDARTLNWRYVVPDEPPGMLLLPVAGETTDRAVVATPGGLAQLLADDAAFPAVAVMDLPSWSEHGGRAGSARLLGRLCGAVEPGGWLCLGFANARYPGSWRRSRTLRLRTVRRVLKRSGMAAPEVYAGLPHHTRPGILVPLRRRAELDFVLHHLFLTYAPADGRAPRLQRTALRLMRQAAVAGPHRGRSAFVPAYCLVTRRLP
jgi:hypothetical protein